MISNIWSKVIRWVENNPARADVSFFLASTLIGIVLSNIELALIIIVIIITISGIIFLVNLFKSIPTRLHLVLLKTLSLALLCTVVFSLFIFKEGMNTNSCGMQSAEKFNAYLQPTMTGTIIKAEFAIKNTTNEPLLLAADYDTPAALSDNKFALATTARTAPTGIKSYSQFLHGPAIKEDFYTHISPGQTHKVGLVFETNFASKISGETNATVTMTFLNLDNGKVAVVAASPCAVMRVGN